jgi:polyphosphate kinase 2
MTAILQPTTGDLDGPDPRAVLERQASLLGFRVIYRESRGVLIAPDGTAMRTWQEGYPYERRLRRGPYQADKQLLQIELAKLQRSVKDLGRRLLIICEGRDAAGKGGAIRRFTEYLNPRGVRVVALDRPAPHQRSDGYLHRYVPHLPARGEIVLFDRSWYNRAGVEHVLGFCEPDEYQQFLQDAPVFERMLAADGIQLVKLWFSVTRAEQLRRLINRQADPLKRWKLSPVDLASVGMWQEYTRAEEVIFAHTDLPDARWAVVNANDKRRARLEVMRYVLSLFEYEGKDHVAIAEPDPLIVVVRTDLR